MTLGEARKIIGSLSFPSKMPGTSYGLPAQACVLGTKLAKIGGTVCSGCYALNDHYAWPNPMKAQQRRLRALADPSFVAAMVKVLLHTHRGPIRVDLGKPKNGSRYRFNEPGWHRWHDSGDLQSVEHLAKICEIANLTTTIRHWLPTQELGIVRRFLSGGGQLPPNLIVRVSSIMMDDTTKRNWPQTSSVYRDAAPPTAHICPAPQQHHECRSCRACWSDAPHVAYRAH